MKYLLISLAFLVCTSLSGQEVEDSFQKADSALMQGKYKEAIRLFDKVIEDKTAQKDIKTLEHAQIKKGKALLGMQLADSTLNYLQGLALSHPSMLFKLHWFLGEVHIANKSGYGVAMESYNKAFTYLLDLDDMSNEQKAERIYELIQYSLATRNQASLLTYMEEYRVFSTRVFPENHYTLGNYQRVKGTTMIFQSQPDSALYYLGESEKNLLQAANSGEEVNTYLADLHSTYAFLYNMLSQSELQLLHGKKQVLYLEKAPVKDLKVIASAYSNLAFDYQVFGDFKASELYVDKAIDMFKSIDLNNSHNLGFAYMTKSVLYTFKPNALNQALEILFEALKIYEASYGPDHPQTSIPIEEIGKAYQRLGQYAKANEYLTRSLAISIKHQDNEKMYRNHLALAGTQSDMKLFKESRESFREGLKIFRKQYDDKHSTYGRFMEYGGSLALNEGKYEEAEQYFKRAAMIYKLNWGNIHPTIASLYLKMAGLYHQNGDYNTALAYTDSVAPTNKRVNNITGEVQVPDMVMNTHARNLKAEILGQLYESNGDIGLLNEIIALHNTNTESILDLVKQSQPGDDLTLYSEQYKTAYSEIIRNSLLILDEDETNTALKEGLFNLSEKSRSLILTMRQHQIKTTNRGKESSPFIMEKLRLEDKVNYQRGLILTASSEASKSQLESELIDINRELEKLLENGDGTDWFGQVTGRDVNLATIQQSLSGDHTIVEYLQLPDQFLVFTISRDSYDIKQLPIPEGFEKSVHDFYSSLEKNDLEAFRKVSFGLYQTLIAPIKELLKNRATIIPDGPLWNVNFDLLLSSNGKQETSFKTLDYLTKAYSFGYAHSAGSLLENQSGIKKNRKGILAFAYDDSPTSEPKMEIMRNSSIANLPGTSNEVNQIAKLLGGRHYFGTEANEQRFKEQAEDHQVIHLAMHAKSDSLENDRSYLYFTPQKNEAEQAEDGLLHIFELYNMRLNADLVVLSACNAGLGELNAAEGNMSFGRAFQHAGVKSVLLSQWEVSDASTPDIMESFYSHLKDGKSKDQALRLAKLSFLESSNNISSNPIYWGSFFVLGNTAPIQFENDSFLSGQNLWILVLVLGGMLVLYLIRKRKVT